MKVKNYHGKVGGFFLFFLVFFTVNPVNASFFDNGTWYMDSGLWVYDDSNDPDDECSFTDQVGYPNDKLQWYSNPTASEEFESSESYYSKWQLSLNHDFKISTDVVFLHMGDSSDSDTYIGIGIFSDNPVNPVKASIYVGGKGSDDEYEDMVTNYVKVETDIYTYPDKISSSWNGEFEESRIIAEYNSTDDELVFKTISGDSDMDSPPQSISRFKKIRAFTGLDRVGVHFTAYSKNDIVDTEEVYMENFSVDNGTFAPEPFGFILFSIGTVMFAVIRRR